MRYLVILLFFSCIWANPFNTNIFFVSTIGNDANPGTQQAPFLTLERARNAVRALPNAAFKSQDVYIYLRGGTYRLSEPLLLTVEDSGREGHNVVYSSYPGEQAILSGAVQVTGWTASKTVTGAYQAPIGNYRSRQLYVNGTARQRARTSAYPVAFLPAWQNGGIEYIVTSMNPTAWQNPNNWTNQQNIEAVILTQWKMMRVPVQSVVQTIPGLAGLITMQQPAWNNANVYLDVSTSLPGIWSFWQVTWFENALQFLTSAGQWYLDPSANLLYYIPEAGENILTADVELPVLENLMIAQGRPGNPIHNLKFEGLTFSYATWMGPSTPQGYVSDQSGMLLYDSSYPPNYIGHVQNVIPTPGNVQFTYAENVVFSGNVFQNLGAVALQFYTGSKNNIIEGNVFTAISSAAIELGGVLQQDHHPTSSQTSTENNLITNNLIYSVATDYNDAAAIFVGFTAKTKISHNTIYNVPWSGIAMGWGWGLLDKGSFPGLPNARSGEWGEYNTFSVNKGCKIVNNSISNFVGVLWDGGAIYTTGQQGPSLAEGLLIKQNVCFNKRPDGGSNIFYTDGGSRCIKLEENVSYNNPIGISFFGPSPPLFDPLPYMIGPSLLNGQPYGSDTGGCRTYGVIQYKGNYFFEPPLLSQIASNNFYLNSILGSPAYNPQGFFDPCIFQSGGIIYPTQLKYKANHFGLSLDQVPKQILQNAGVQQKPSTIPTSLWVLP